MRKTTFPEGDASNNQLARYLYYTGRFSIVDVHVGRLLKIFFQSGTEVLTWPFLNSESKQCSSSTQMLSAACSKHLAKHHNRVRWGIIARLVNIGTSMASYFMIDRFRKTVYKFSIIVQLLLGEIPDRSIFSQKVFFCGSTQNVFPTN
jgi:hypothetical protein